MRSTVKFRGLWLFECFDHRGRPVWRQRFKNMTCLAGINDLLSVYLAGGTQKTTWYMGLIDNATFSGLAASDTIASNGHSGWAEATFYSNSVRPTWTPGSVSGQSVTNPSATVFNINGSGTVRGAFLVSSSTISGTSGILWATGTFSSPQTVQNGQTLNVTYQASGTGS